MKHGSLPCRLIVCVFVALLLLATLSSLARSRHTTGHAPVLASRSREIQLQDLASLERAMASGEPLDAKALGGCSAALQLLHSARGWCQSIEDLQVCSQKLHIGAAAHCSEALREGGDALSALRRIGAEIRAAVLDATVSDPKTSLRCTSGDDSQDIRCIQTDLASKCQIDRFGHDRDSADLCRALLTQDACMIYTFGAISRDGDETTFARSPCNSFAFNPAFQLAFSFKGRSAFFKAGAARSNECAGNNCSLPSSASAASMRKLSGHKRISALVFNCGGCEYQLAQDVLVNDPNFFFVVDQVYLEVHLDHRMASAMHATQLGLLFALLAKAGLHLLHVRIRKCAHPAVHPCPDHLKASGFFCDEQRRCLGLLFSRLHSKSVPAIDDTRSSQSLDAGPGEYPRLLPEEMMDASGREAFFTRSCAVDKIGGYGNLRLTWSMDEQTTLCRGCMLLGNIFVSDREWQKRSGYGSAESEGVTGKYTDCAKTRSCTPLRVTFDNLKMYYDSVKESGCCCTLLHDGAFDSSFIERHQTERMRFLKVDVLRLNTIFNRKFGLNDARFFAMHEAFCAHKGWQKVFFSDIFDVKIGRSPCKNARPGTLYVGTDNAAFQSTWLRRRFSELGTKYLEFFEHDLWKESQRLMWSAGIVGAGDRETMREFLGKLLSVLTDPEIVAVKQGEYQGVNMAAVNFVAERFFKGRTSGGPPLNSKYRSYERKRQDVWFIHK